MEFRLIYTPAAVKFARDCEKNEPALQRNSNCGASQFKYLSFCVIQKKYYLRHQQRAEQAERAFRRSNLYHLTNNKCVDAAR